MAKVVLVWNEHPVEVVAGYHARKVAEILRRNYGHKVIIEKIPAAETNYGILSDSKNADEAIEKLAKLKPSILIARKFAKKHHAPAFNFHASHYRAAGDADSMAPEQFRLKEFEPGETLLVSPVEISVNKFPKREYYVVEVPGIEKAISDRTFEKRRAKYKEALLVAWNITDPKKRRIAEKTLAKRYHFSYMPLSQQQKYLHSAISEKIAAAISKIISK